MTVDILCKVVDNLGDIGFAYRLSRTLASLCASEMPELTFTIRLIVDDLTAFAAVCDCVDPSLSVQNLGFCTLIQWESPGEEGLRLFQIEKPRIVIETYACGRPAWFESILFEPTNDSSRHIINLEYLTAEDWAKDFHLLPSLTRSKKVSKSFFMPGFVQGTGGLLQDSESVALRERCTSLAGTLEVRREALLSVDAENKERIDPHSFWVFIFTYEHNFTPIIQDLAAFHSHTGLTVILAAGRSSEPFLTAWKAQGCPFPVLALPPIPQRIWDSFLVSVDFAIVRGEESFAQAALNGNPFVWECYPFYETKPANSEPDITPIGHWPKVEAFLHLISPYIQPDSFIAYKRLVSALNGMEPLKQGDLLSVLSVISGFSEFSARIQRVGNLGSQLLEYICKIE